MRLPENFFIKVPFEEKEDAKKLGAKWNNVKKNWFVPVGQDVLEFKKWFAFLTVSVEKKEEIKKRGAKWDNNLKRWYVPNQLKYEDFEDFWNIDKNLIEASNKVVNSIENIDVFEGRYRILKDTLCSGGTAQVILCEDIKENNIRKALKIYDINEKIDEEESKLIFDREMQALQDLNEHPNIVKIYDYGFSNKLNTNFIVLEECLID